MKRALALFLCLVVKQLWGDYKNLIADLALAERGVTVQGRITSRVEHAHGLVRYEFVVANRVVSGGQSGGAWPKDDVLVTFDKSDPSVNALGFYPTRARDTILAGLLANAGLATVVEALVRWRSRRRAVPPAAQA